MAKLGEVCEVSPSTKNIERQGAWLLNLDMVEQQTGRVIEYKYVGEDDLNGSIIQFDTENVLYSKLRPNLNKVVLPQKDGFSTSELLPLRPDARVLNRDYLAVFLRSDSFVTWAVSKTAGAKMPRLGTKDLMSAEIPVPTIEQQKKIAEKFKKLEQLISLRKQQLAKLNELVKAQFANTFENDADFHTDYMENLSEFVTVGIANSATHAYAEHGVVMLRNQNIKENHLDDTELVYIEPKFADKYKSKKLEANDILVTRTGYPGIACVVPQKYAGSQTFTTLIIRLKKETSVSSCYICHYINSSHGKKYVSGTKVGVAQQNFGAKVLAKMPVIVPPIELQNQFATFVARIDQQKQTVQQSLEKLELMKKALMQEYFG